MRSTLPALAVSLALAALATTATAQPKPGSTFTTPVTYVECTTSFAFACNIPDGNGGHYGTAHPQQFCHSITFAPNGTVDLDGTLTLYRIADGKVRFFQRLDGSWRRWELPITGDGAMVGNMKRVAP